MVSGDNNNNNNRSHHHSADFLLIKQDDKFFSRLLSKESTVKGGESSFRYYYCGGSSCSIPFVWESQPGTPKHKFSDISLPPLTPPPSYQTNAPLRKQSKSNFFFSIFPKIIPSKRITTSPSVSSSCSSSSFSISSVQTMAYNSSNRRNYRFEEYDHDKMQQIPSSPTSTLCFGCRMGNSKRFRVNSKNVKKAFSTFVGN
ncbi:hypothetical protein MTR67_027043 [Solanum verrucosum]|uniref:Uncharacterized protein n=1 Tax=Solanum verrucosum TaxID=315347 RepID=A0AAF0R2X3_SOLVR|nr:hypothetical protein MTR67_027043 [Solanum verrucosum]